MLRVLKKEKESPAGNNYKAKNNLKDSIATLSKNVVNDAPRAVWLFSFWSRNPPPVKNDSKQYQESSSDHHILPMLL